MKIKKLLGRTILIPGLSLAVTGALVMQPARPVAAAQTEAADNVNADQSTAAGNAKTKTAGTEAAHADQDAKTDSKSEETKSLNEMPELNSKSMLLSLPTEEEQGWAQGAVKNFQFDPFSGSGIINLPIFALPGRNGMQPALSLIYSPRNGNGLMGVGWQIQFPAIEVSTKNGVPEYGSSLKYMAHMSGGGMELVKTATGIYSPRFFTGGVSDFHLSGNQWHVWDKSGKEYEFGLDGLLEDDSRVCDPADPSRCYRFYLSKIKDVHGNYIFFRHFTDGGFEILYTGEPDTDTDSLGAGTHNFAVKIVGEVEADPRPDPVISYRAGFETRIDKRLKEIRIYAKTELMKKYVFEYAESLRTRRSLLIRITAYGADGESTRPALTFAYHDAEDYLYEHTTGINIDHPNNQLFTGDFNGDGKTDLGTYSPANGNLKVALSQGESFETKAVWAPNYEYSATSVLPGDYNADGKTDICVYNQGTWKVVFSNGTSFDDQGVWATELVSEKYPGAGDFNGDGLTDIIAYFKENGIWKGKIALNSDKTGFDIWAEKDFIVAPDHTNRFIADFNGDGLSDFVAHSQSTATWFIRLNNGDLHDEFTPLAEVTAFCPASYSGERRGFLADITGSGLSDMACWGSDCQPFLGQVGYNTSMGDHVYKTRVLPFTFNTVGANTGITPADFNGDGVTDYAVYTDASNIEIAYSRGIFTDLLIRSDNGIGGVTSIEYELSSNHPNAYLPFVIPVLKSTTVSNSRGDSYTTEYEYSGGLWDAAEREFFGFETVRVIDPAGNYSESKFRQDDAYLKGRPAEQAQYDYQNKIYSKTENTWAVDVINSSVEPPVKFTYLERTDNHVYNTAQEAKRTAQEFTYGESPQTGNLTKVEQLGEVNVADGQDVPGDSRTVETEYVKNTDSQDIWLHGLPKQTTVRNNTGEIMRRTWFYYDNSDDLNADPVKGMLTKKVDWVGDDPEAEDPVTRYAYTAYGNLNSTIDPRNNTISIVYDNEFHTFPVITQNALGHQVISAYYGVDGVPLNNNGYAGLWGQVKSKTDPNGQPVFQTHDTFGRVTKTVGPLDTLQYPTSLIGYEDGDTYTKITNKQRIEHGQPQTIDAVEYYDGLGRLIQAKTVSGNAGEYVVSGQTEYNPRGLPEKKYIPRFTSLGLDEMDPIDPGAPHTFIEYDAIGRVTQTVNPDDSFSDASYDNWTVTARDENGHQQKSYFNAYGRLIKKEEYEGSDGRCSIYPEQAYTLYAETFYSYDSEGNLIQTKDAHNNITGISYDKLGRKVEMNDPDMGLWKYGYDLNGNLAWQEDAKGQIISFEYDALNRLRNKTDGTTLNVDYYYDDPIVAFSKGRLTSVHYGPNDKTEFYYDALGRETKSVKTIDGIGYTVERKYDALNNLKEVTYPDGKKAFYQYNAAGQVNAVAGDESFIGPQSSLRRWQALRDVIRDSLDWCEKHILGIREVYADEIPAVPVLNSATAGDTQVALDWTFVPEANGYEVKYFEAGGSGGSGTNYTLDPGCMGGWLLDEASGNLMDACNNNNGTKHGYLQAGVQGPFDGALELFGYPDGNNAYVNFGSDASLDNLGARTITAWIRPDSLGDYNLGVILDKGESWGWGLSLYNNNRLRFYQGFEGGAVKWLSPPGSIQLGVWQHIAIVYPGTGEYDEPVFYINGNPAGTSLASSPPYGSLRTGNWADLRLGLSYYNVYEFDGVIDEIAVFNRALSMAEVAEIMSAGLAGGGTAYTVFDAGNVINYTVAGLTNGTEYAFSVRSYNGAGRSEFSNELNATPQSGIVLPPAAPDLISATAGNGSVDLSWSTVSGADEFKIYYGTSPGSYSQEAMPGDVTDYTVNGLSNGVTYYFVVTALNSAGESGVSNELSAMPNIPAPSAPVLNTADPGNGYVSLGWDMVWDATGYEVHYGTSSGNYSDNVSAGNAGNYTVTGLSNGTEYYFVITAENQGGQSGYSNELSATPYVAVPLTPVLNTPFGGDSLVQLSWDAVPDADDYTIRYTTSGSGGGTDFTQDNSCRGGWRMDEVSGDFIDSCNDNDGTKHGYLQAGVDGQFDSALELFGYSEGNNAHVNFGSGTSLDDLGARTIAAWIRPDSLGDYNMGVILDKGESWGWGVSLYSNNRLRFYQGFEGGAVTWLSSANALQMGAWQHIAVVYPGTGENDEPVFYINGSPAGTSLASSPPYGSPRTGNWADLLLGKSYYDVYEFDGRIDEVAVFDRALSAEEIAGLMSNGITGSAGAPPATEVPVGDVTNYAVGGLQNGVEYFFTVSASNSAGESPRSDAVSATPFAVVEAPVNYIVDIQYNVMGQKTAVVYANGTETAYQYNDRNFRLERMTTVSGQSQTLQDFQYVYDNAGNIVEIVDNVNTADQTFEYDALNRLVEAAGYQYGTKSYAYDEVGNILSKDGVQYFYGENGAGPHAVTSLDNGLSFDYDLNGNMTGRQEGGESTGYFYDAENRLRVVQKKGGTIAEYEYDGDGGRTQKRALSGAEWGTTRFIGSLFEITPDRISRYVYLGGERIAAVNNGQTAYYFSDHLGGLNVATDVDGNVLELVEYTPFGSLSRQEKTQGGDAAHHYFTGQRLDDETGLYYYGARYYNPGLGRFITADMVVQDPNGDPQTFNRYSYCGNNPVNRIDPDGQSWFSKLIGGILGIATTIFTGGQVGLGLAVFNMVDSTIDTYQATGNFGLAMGIGVGVSIVGGISGGLSDLFFTETIGKHIKSKAIGSFFGELFGSSIGAGVSSGLTSKSLGGKFSSGFYQGAASGAIFYSSLRLAEIPVNKIKKMLYEHNVQTKGEAGNLVIKAYRGDGNGALGSATTDGHAWVENLNGDQSFGAWPDSHPGNSMFANNPNVSKTKELWFNREANLPALRSAATVKTIISLSTDQVNGFGTFVSKGLDWGKFNNCSSGAVNMWRSAGGGAINNRSMLGIPTVKALADSIGRGYGY